MVNNLEINFIFFVSRHTNEMIKKLETAGLGYHVGAVDTYEKIGKFFICHFVFVFFYVNILAWTFLWVFFSHR